GGGRGRYAMAGLPLEIVGAEPGAHELRRSVSLKNRPLAGPEHADGRRTLLPQHGLALLGHDVERLIPRDRLELSLLVEHAIALAQKRRGQAICAIHDLGEEIALDAVEAAIGLCRHGAVCGDHVSVLGGDHDTAAGTAETAGSLRPLYLECADTSEYRLRHGRCR